MSESAVQQARKVAIPKSTQADTTWCFSLWTEWAKQRNRRTNEEQVPLNILAMSPPVLQHWSGCPGSCSNCVKRMESEYTPDTLYHIACGVMHYLHQNGRPELDFLSRNNFGRWNKATKWAGFGNSKKHAEPLSEEELL